MEIKSEISTYTDVVFRRLGLVDYQAVHFAMSRVYLPTEGPKMWKMKINISKNNKYNNIKINYVTTDQVDSYISRFYPCLQTAKTPFFCVLLFL